MRATNIYCSGTANKGQIVLNRGIGTNADILQEVYRLQSQRVLDTKIQLPAKLYQINSANS